MILDDMVVGLIAFVTIIEIVMILENNRRK